MRLGTEETVKMAREAVENLNNGLSQRYFYTEPGNDGVVRIYGCVGLDDSKKDGDYHDGSGVILLWTSISWHGTTKDIEAEIIHDLRRNYRSMEKVWMEKSFISDKNKGDSYKTI